MPPPRISYRLRLVPHVIAGCGIVSSVPRLLSIASQALQWDPVFGLDQSLFVAVPMMLGLSFLLKV